MTPDALSAEVLALAGRYRVDSSLSLNCIPAAEKIREHTSSSDLVIWPFDQGGLAWEATGKTYKRRAGDKIRVFCISWNFFPETPELWKQLDKAASTVGRRIISVKLYSGEHGGFSLKRKPRYPVIIQKLLDVLFPAAVPPVSESDQPDWDSVFFHIPVSMPLSEYSFEGKSSGKTVKSVFMTDASEKLPEVYNLWIKESPSRIHIGTDVDIRERILAVSAASSAGLLPVVSLAQGESAAAAVLLKAYLKNMTLDKELKAIIRVQEDWSAVSVFQSVLDIPILTPVSDMDIQGALKWAADASKLVLIIDPGKSSIPVKVQHKKTWISESFLLLKEKNSGSAGRILLIVPGILAKEAGKAADRLVKNNFSVTVISLRFIQPLEPSEIVRFSEDFDLVIITDPDKAMGGFKADLGMCLIKNDKTHVVIPESAMSGKALAEYAAGIHREDRFRRTVDDVKKDRWR